MVKRLYRFIVETFVPVFLMTFFVCLFVLLMQFLFRYVNELVGKGLSFKILGEFFLYASASLVPLALPLSILLSSLMTFGNLGERLELLAMKSSGIPLLQTMKPLIFVVSFISIGSFFFQNEVMPKVQVKMWTLLFSMRQKTPELDIPEGVFYDQIQGYNMFVQSKNKKTGMLYDVMIYDFSKGFDNASVTVSDSAYLLMTEDKKYLFMTFYTGESFENLQDQRTSMQNVPYRRENFREKVVLIEFDASFNRMDDSFLQGQYVGMRMDELKEAGIKARKDLDSLSLVNGKALSYTMPITKRHDIRTIAENPEIPSRFSNVDSLYRSKSLTDKEQIILRAVSDVTTAKQEIEFRSFQYSELKQSAARFNLEWHRKITISFACLLFFFIGAPLGAIVRKGGLGLPVVLSVILFIAYYIIDNTGYKFARDSRLSAFFGMWLSSFVLAPLGAFLTYKAMKDSVLMNSESMLSNFFKRFKKRTKREIILKSIKLQVVDAKEIYALLTELNTLSITLLAALKERSKYSKFWKKDTLIEELKRFSALEEEIIERILQSDFIQIQNKLTDYPELKLLWYSLYPTNEKARRICMYCVPVGFVGFIQFLQIRKQLYEDIYTTQRVNNEILNILPKI